MAFVVAALSVRPEYRRVRAIEAASPLSKNLPAMDAFTMAFLSVGAATVLSFVALLFVSRVRRESFRVLGVLSAPAVLGLLATMPVYSYVYGQFPGLDHVSIPSVYRWSGPVAIAAALVAWGLLRLWLHRASSHARATPRPEA